MLSLRPKQNLIALAVLALVASSTGAQADDPNGGVIFDVNGANRGLYPIATPTAPSGGKDAADVAQIESMDLSLAGVFKVVDPKAFLADLNAEQLGIEPQKWKDVGAFGVVKYQVSGDSIEFRLYEVSKGTTPVLTKTYKRAGTSTRQLVHRWDNEVVKYYTHEPGFFGSQIAFTQKGKGSSQIMAMDFDGANAFQVSHNSSTNILPAWSPTGAQIAYTSFMRDNPDLYVGTPNGSRPRKLSGQRGMNTGASWSPDGTKIALTLSKDGNPEIYIISSNDGSIVKRITNDKAIDTSPAWSPDGNQLAFVSDRNGGPQIFVVSSNGGNATQVSFNGDYNTTPTWSPKAGKHVIAYTTRAGGNYDIVTLDVDTKAMTRITQNEGNNEEPAFSPNGKVIAYARQGQGVYISNADGSGHATKVYAGNVTGIDWGPAPRE
ncbi:MAG TPA: LpqB family beta-propeller domain-containing protein [Kofleriaceae bacterium]|nr:LpqB family beta-propeller domain-containing protein [Kofleriaceae bacterium]